MSIVTLRILTQFSTGFETFSALSNFFCWATIDGALTECLLKKFETFVMLTLHFQMVRWSNWHTMSTSFATPGPAYWKHLHFKIVCIFLIRILQMMHDFNVCFYLKKYEILSKEKCNKTELEIAFFINQSFLLLFSFSFRENIENSDLTSKFSLLTTLVKLS